MSYLMKLISSIKCLLVRQLKLIAPCDQMKQNTYFFYDWKLYPYLQK